MLTCYNNCSGEFVIVKQNKHEKQNYEIPWTYLWYELPLQNLTFGDDHARLNATVHFPWGSTHAEAETAAQRVSPADEDMDGPESKFSWAKCPS